MKVEYRYSISREPDDGAARPSVVVIYYFYTGERVGPGHYTCTFCGERTRLPKARTLPPCQICDSAEYQVDAAA